MPDLDEAQEQLKSIIKKGRVDLYKPIQIAEVLFRSRTVGGLDLTDLNSYKNASLHWRNNVSQRLLGKVSTSSAQFQHNVWADNAMPPSSLVVLDEENKLTNGAVERFIYNLFMERQATVAAVIEHVDKAEKATFKVASLLELFITQPGIKRSVDKAYEIVTYSLFETVVRGLEAEVRVSVPVKNQAILIEFADLAKVLLNVDAGNLERTESAHIYRVGVTNAADRGLDMWANFGPAIQVKHLTLKADLANKIVDQVESDHVVIVCRDAEAEVIQTVVQQIGWGQRVRGIVKETELVEWYERCLRGKFSNQLGDMLLRLLTEGFKAEFPQAAEVVAFCEERGYTALTPPERWLTASDEEFDIE